MGDLVPIYVVKHYAMFIARLLEADRDSSLLLFNGPKTGLYLEVSKWTPPPVLHPVTTEMAAAGIMRTLNWTIYDQRSNSYVTLTKEAEAGINEKWVTSDHKDENIGDMVSFLYYLLMRSLTINGATLPILGTDLSSELIEKLIKEDVIVGPWHLPYAAMERQIIA